MIQTSRRYAISRQIFTATGSRYKSW